MMMIKPLWPREAEFSIAKFLSISIFFHLKIDLITGTGLIPISFYTFSKALI